MDMETFTTEEIYEKYSDLEALSMRAMIILIIIAYGALTVFRMAENMFATTNPLPEIAYTGLHALAIFEIIAFILLSISFFHARKAMRMIEIIASEEFEDEELESENYNE